LKTTPSTWRSSQSVSNSSQCRNPCSAGKVQGIRWITSIAPGPIGPSTRIRLVLSAHRLKFPTTENREIRASEQRVRRANREQYDEIHSARRQIFESGNLDEYLERTGLYPRVLLPKGGLTVGRVMAHYAIRPHSALGYRPPAPEIIESGEELPITHEAA
jgi:hypothetical protein